jgi:UDP-2-acetamido-3-amino-2,3-dideoxy-glucuronate N-acetyltransferase
MSNFDAERHPDVHVHESAYVDEPCVIGAGTKIWHFTHVMPNCVIGERCNLGQNVVVSPDVRLGNNVKVQNNVSLYTGVILEDDVFCGPSMVFTNVVNPRSEIVRRSEYRTTTVRRGATLGANSTVVCGTEIGRYAFVAAGAVITKDVEPYALMIGVPARRVGWMCRCGERLADAAAESGAQTCGACGNTYREEGGALRPVLEHQGEEKAKAQHHG